MNSEADQSGTDGDELDWIAAAWADERRDGFSPERQEAFVAWCEADPRHRAALARCEQALALLGRIDEIREPLERAAAPPAGRNRGWLGANRRPWWVGLAAALALGASVGWWGAAGKTGEQRIVATESIIHEQALADGSIVAVNAGGEMRVRMTEETRRVLLDAGEAHFDVAPDPERPFVVEAGEVSVRALGTAFNVVAGATHVDVTVAHGRVEVVVTGKEGANAVVLGVGERASVARAAPAAATPVEKLDATRLREALAWRRQTVSFSDTPLLEVVERFNRGNVIQLVIADPELARHKIGGTFAVDQVEDFLRLLEQEGEVAVESRGHREIVLRRAAVPAR